MSTNFSTTPLSSTAPDSETVPCRGSIRSGEAAVYEFHSQLSLSSSGTDSCIELNLPGTAQPVNISQLAELVIGKEANTLDIEIPAANLTINIQPVHEYYAKVEIRDTQLAGITVHLASFYLGKDFQETLEIKENKSSILSVTENGYIAVVPDTLSDTFLQRFDSGRKRLFLDMTKYCRLLACIVRLDSHLIDKEHQIFDHHNLVFQRQGSQSALFNSNFTFRTEQKKHGRNEARLIFLDTSLKKEEKAERLVEYLGQLKRFLEDCKGYSRQFHRYLGVETEVKLEDLKGGLYVHKWKKLLGNDDYGVIEASSQNSPELHHSLYWVGCQQDLPLSTLCQETIVNGAYLTFSSADCPYGIRVLPEQYKVARVLFKSKGDSDYPSQLLADQPNQALIYGHPLFCEQTVQEKYTKYFYGECTTDQIPVSEKPDQDLVLLGQRFETIEKLVQQLHDNKYTIQGLPGVYLLPNNRHILKFLSEPAILRVDFANNHLNSLCVRNFSEENEPDQKTKTQLDRFFTIMRNACIKNSLDTVLQPVSPDPAA